MKRVTVFALTVSSISCGITDAAAEWSWDLGAEYFQWRESTAPSVTEKGPIFALGVNWTQDKDAGLLAAYRGKLYGGVVNYYGATQSFDPSTGQITYMPADEKTTYVGITNEVQAIYRAFYSGNAFSVEYVGGLGWDYWERKIGTNTDNSQEEDYGIAYLRLGADINSRTERGVFGGGGIKYPIYTQEDAHFTDLGFDQNPTLHPGKEISGYAQLGYRFDKQNNVIAYYEGYRFSQSNTVFLTTQFIPGVTFLAFQPKSTMTVIGLKYQCDF